MKAAVYYGPEDTRFEDVEDPVCPAGGLVIKVHYVGICGSDVRTYYSGSAKIKPPMILGHEAVGEVIAVDEAHDTYKIGDRLAMAPGIFCNKCYYCRAGMTTMCENLVELAFQYPGGFAEHMPLPGIAFERGRIVEIPEGLSYKHAALCEAISSCVMAMERANVSLGDAVVIFGAGPIGCIDIQVARARGASKVIIIDISAERLEMAKAFGPDCCIDASKQDPVAIVQELTQGLGADKAIIATPAAAAWSKAIEIVRRRGTVIAFGGLPKDNPQVSLDGNLIHYLDITLMGHYGQEKRHVQQALELLSRKQISAEKLITNVLPLDDIAEGVRLMKEKKALKVLLKT